MESRPRLSRTSPPCSRVIFSHPVYRRSFLAFGVHDTIGFPLTLALDACRIVTDTTSGFLSSSHDATLPPASGPFLVPGNYYFHSDSIREYSIIPDFDAWTPPTSLPPHWKTPDNDLPLGTLPTRCMLMAGTPENIATEIPGLDSRQCVLTNHNLILQTAYLVPPAHSKWFSFHHISDKLQPPYPIPDDSHPIHDLRNAVTNETGIQSLFDAGHWTYVPTASSRYMCFFFMRVSCTSVPEYHRVEASIPKRIPNYLLYLRFAWMLFESYIVREHGLKIRGVVSFEEDEGDQNEATHSLKRKREGSDSEMVYLSRNSFPKGDDSAHDSVGDGAYEAHPEIAAVIDRVDFPYYQTLREEYKAKHPEVSTTVEAEKEIVPIPDLEVKMRPLTNREVFEMVIGAPCPDWED